MTEIEAVRDTINGIAVLAFLVLSLVALVIMAERAVRHRVFGTKAPILLYRDLLLVGALALLTLMPALWSLAFGTVLAQELWWVVVRSVIGVSAMGIWVYFETRVIGRARE